MVKKKKRKTRCDKQIPDTRGAYKFLYFIKVKLKQNEVLKFGISNNIIRRLKNYNDSESIGYLIDIIHIYRCKYPKHIESMLKWVMRSIGVRPFYSQEYFDLSFLPYLLHHAYYLSEYFGDPLKEIQISDIKIK